MQKTLTQYFKPPVFPDDEKTRSARFINAIVLSNIPVLLLFLIIRIASGSPLFSVPNQILIALMLILASAWGVMRSGFVRLAGFILVGMIWLATTLLALSGNGVRGTGFTGYFVVIVMAGLLLGWRAAFGITALSILSGFGLVYAESLDIVTFEFAPALGTAIETTVLFIFSAIFIYLIITSLQHAIAAARATASELARSNKDLTELQAVLENRVSERTTALETAKQESESRAQELQTISDVARTITSEQNIDVLLPLVTRLVSEKYDFYHVGIFLVDENREYAVLRAANSDGGKRMLDRGHRLEVGQTGIVGYVANTGQPRIALDVGTDSVFFNNPDLKGTRSEMALPLKARGQVIGVLDAQSTKAGAFSKSDSDTLAILADQIAIAIENARLFGESQFALNEVQSLYAQYLNQEWNTFAHKGTKIGYQQSSVQGRELEVPVESEGIRQALSTGELVIHNPNDAESAGTIIMPVKLRGQAIGVLNIKSPYNGRRWSDDEINMIRVISDRLALALENARLFEETTRTAEREKLVSDITTSIRSTNDPQTMIDMAVSELRRALGVSRVEIIPQRITSPGTEI